MTIKDLGIRIKELRSAGAGDELDAAVAQMKLLKESSGPSTDSKKSITIKTPKVGVGDCVCVIVGYG